MQSAELNLTTTVTGHQRFLFIKLPESGVADGVPKPSRASATAWRTCTKWTARRRQRPSGGAVTSF